MTLTDKQIDNWRNVLALCIGPYAYKMPVVDIEARVARLQEEVDRREEDRLPTYHEDRASRTVAEDRAMKAREAAKKQREDRLVSLSQRIANALDE
jgi:hypothetical protein